MTSSFMRSIATLKVLVHPQGRLGYQRFSELKVCVSLSYSRPALDFASHKAKFTLAVLTGGLLSPAREEEPIVCDFRFRAVRVVREVHLRPRRRGERGGLEPPREHQREYVLAVIVRRSIVAVHSREPHFDENILNALEGEPRRGEDGEVEALRVGLEEPNREVAAYAREHGRHRDHRHDDCLRRIAPPRLQRRLPYRRRPQRGGEAVVVGDHGGEPRLVAHGGGDDVQPLVRSDLTEDDRLERDGDHSLVVIGREDGVDVGTNVEE
mmetsp:Transcript_23330/g.57913  ORF Transcript_23330/g.57913 Transcript_23330/m.57913 type:complete len:267 (+) Transcript_23330:365-1165(+)